MIFALWRILAKVGMHDWAIFIPVYNVYCLFKLAFEDALVSMLLYIGFGFWGMLLDMVSLHATPFIAGVFLICMAVLCIGLVYRISVNFGHGAGYTLGLILMPYLFVFLLGWGNDDYVRDRKKIQHDAGISTSESGNGKSKKWLLIPVILIILVAGGAIYAGKAWNSVFHNVEASQNVSSEKQNVENLEDQNTEVPKEESKLQYTVTTGGTRLNIRKEPRVDAEFTEEEIAEMFQN